MKQLTEEQAQAIEDMADMFAPDNQYDTVAMARALCPFAENASDELMLICAAVVEAKGDLDVVVYYLTITKSQIVKHLRSHLAEQILKELAKHKLHGEGYLLAVSALMDVARSRGYAGAARNSASKLLIDMVDKNEDDDPSRGRSEKDLNSMTLKELEAFVGSIKKDLISVGGKAADTGGDLLILNKDTLS